jgi:adenosine deaminase
MTARLVDLPKVQLHVHLESAVRWPSLHEIGAANGVDVPGHLEHEGRAFRGLPDFVEQNELIRECLRRAADFRRIALEFCEDEAAQGTRYAEITFAAVGHGERLGDLEMPLLAVLDGLAEGRDRFGIECRLILDHSRRRSVERAWRTLDLAAKYRPDGVVAIGLAGDESFPAAPFAGVFAAAPDAGLRVVHHAGEALGPDSIREALAAGAQRLGHGIRILADADLVAEVRERGIALEVCPSSNVALGFAPSLAEHPLPALRDAGLTVTVNTDIPALTGATITGEYAGIRAAFGYGDDVLAELARAGVDASFAPEATKARLHREIQTWLTLPTQG